MSRFRFDAFAALLIPRLLVSGAILSASLIPEARAEPHPRQSVTVLAVNDGQEVLVDLGVQGDVIGMVRLRSCMPSSC